MSPDSLSRIHALRRALRRRALRAASSLALALASAMRRFSCSLSDLPFLTGLPAFLAGVLGLSLMRMVVVRTVDFDMGDDWQLTNDN